MVAISTRRPASWKIFSAFAIIYIVWGSTYLAIRVGVREMPPFLMAGIRFTVAGLGLYAWMRVRGTPAPNRREWRAALVLGTLMFLLDYACLFWAEQRIPSGISAVILAMIPVCISVLEIAFLGTQRLTLRLILGLTLGVLGVAILIDPWSSLGEAALDRRGVVALLVACVGWSVGTIITPRLTLPSAKAMSAAAQMLSGGLELLTLAAVAGEFRHIEVRQVSAAAWFSLVYLIVAGSIIAFTAYVWLLYFESPTKVGTYAYVNPLVAVVLGAALGGETVGRRTLLSTVLILLSVLAIARMKARQKRPGKQKQSTRETLASPAD